MKPLIGVRHGGHLLFILLRVLISQFIPSENRMRYVLNGMVAALRILEIKRPEVDGIVGAVIQPMESDSYETPSLFILSSDVEFYSSVFKDEVIEAGKPIAILSIQKQA